MREQNSKVTLSLSTPEDVLAAVPVLLGFHPARSLVVLGVEGASQMHARVDHPRNWEEYEDCSKSLVEPMQRNGITGCLLVSYTDDGEAAVLMRQEFTRHAEEAGITVHCHLRVNDGRFQVQGDGAAWEPADGVPFEASNHPFIAQAVVEGTAVPRASREALADSLASDRDQQTAVSGFLPGARARTAGSEEGALVDQARWMQQRVRQFLADGERLDVGEVARMIAGMQHSHALREVVWAEINRRTARRMVALLSDLVRRTPRGADGTDPVVLAPSGLLAFAAWQAGDGALSWAALEICFRSDPGYHLGLLVAQALNTGTHPRMWPAMDPETLPVFGEVAALA